MYNDQIIILGFHLSAMYKKLVCLFCACAFVLSLKAQEGDGRRERDTLTLYFDQGQTHIKGYTDTEHSLEARLQKLRLRSDKSQFGIRAISLGASTSPEGNSQSNRLLAQSRANTLKDYLRVALPSLSLDSISVVDLSWSTFEELLCQSTLAHKEEALDVVRNTPIWVVRSGKVVDSRKRRLMTLDNGHFWQQIYEDLFPRLRFARVIVEYQAPEEEEGTTVPPTDVATRQEMLPSIEAPINLKDEIRTIPVGIRTNLLYDAILIPNVGFEFSMGNRWSIVGSWAYSWWHSDRKHYYWRLYGGDLEFRRYWGKRGEWYGLERPFTGHHLGVYAGLVTYDFELGGRGYLGEHWSYYGGVSYGYSLPIGKRLNLDFTLGIGYLGGRYKEYLPDDDCYVWQVTKQRNYIGPTKAEISLVWLLDFTRKLRKYKISR